MQTESLEDFLDIVERKNEKRKKRPKNYWSPNGESSPWGWLFLNPIWT